jgi:DNA-binding MarR family transcriptional regulator
MTALQALTHARKHGITPAALHPLLALVEDSPLGPSELSRRIGSSRANMTGLIDRLVRDGWIERTENKQDRRQFVLIPTERAFEILTPAIEEDL